MNKVLLQVVVQVLPLVWAAISPLLKEAIKDGLVSLEAKAKETDNPLDDIAVQILKDILEL